MSSALQPETETVRWYADKVRRFGYDHRGLGFRTRSSQELRFSALLGLGDLSGSRILDVGCGFGDLLPFLRERGIATIYTGVDICPEMIGHCRGRFGGEGRFLVDDVLDFEPDEGYDYVVASGIFGLEAEGARERIAPTLERMFRWARVGAAANFLSSRSPVPVAARVYVEPCEALRLGYELTPSLRLDHSYLPNDFTLHLYKTPAWESDAGRTP